MKHNLIFVLSFLFVFLIGLILGCILVYFYDRDEDVEHSEKISVDPKSNIFLDRAKSDVDEQERNRKFGNNDEIEEKEGNKSEELVRLRERLFKANKEISRIKESLKVLLEEKEGSALQEKKFMLYKKKLENNINILKAENIQLNEEKTNLENKNSNLKAIEITTNNELINLVLKNHELNKIIGNLENENKDLKEKVQNMKNYKELFDDLDEKNHKKNNLIFEIGKLENRILSLNKEIEVLNDSRGSLNYKKEILEETCKGLNERIAEYRIQEYNLKCNNGNLSKEKTTLEEKINKLITELEKKVDIRKLIKTQEDLKKTIYRLKQDRDMLIEEIEEYEEKKANIIEKLVGNSDYQQLENIKSEIGEKVKEIEDSFKKGEIKSHLIEEFIKYVDQMKNILVDIFINMSKLQQSESDLDKTVERLKDEEFSLLETISVLEEKRNVLEYPMTD